MLFSSISFLYYFLPAVLILYFIVPFKFKNAVLLAFSLFFYAWGGVKYAITMVVAIILGYIFGLLVEKYRGRKISKLFLFLAVASIISFMLYFKYMDFFIDNFNKILGLNIPLLRIVLPIGISFYTFQIISYVVDVYRGEKAQKNPINLAAYVAMFPQLIAGPIVRYADVARELECRTHSLELVAAGARRFIIGLAKKVLIANSMYDISEIVYKADEKTVLFYWIYGISVALYIYFDFSGYSDMAIGLGKIFGFNFLENFNYPYISRSATEFWRRWHMSLGSWFRDYVYIPLGGNRVPKWRWFINIFAVWLFTGFWHGASWNFILWGLFFGVLLVIEKFWLLKYLEKTRVLSRIYILLAAMTSFMVFNINTLGEAFQYIGGLFGAGGIPFVNAATLYHLRNYAVLLIFAIVGSTPLIKNVATKLANSPKTAKVVSIVEPIVLVALLVVVTAFLVDSSSNPFLYFRF
ncbi:MAG: MBOAT family protein [Ruminococcaceae bacterium]|nr:MBOAT family protein [Oscillospiraceae bacterium]